MKCPTCGKEQGVYIQKPMMVETWATRPVRNTEPLQGWYMGVMQHPDGSIEFLREPASAPS